MPNEKSSDILKAGGFCSVCGNKKPCPTHGEAPESENNLQELAKSIMAEVEAQSEKLYGISQVIDMLVEACAKLDEKAGFVSTKAELQEFFTYGTANHLPKMLQGDNYSPAPDDYTTSGDLNFLGKKILSFSAMGDGYGFSVEWDEKNFVDSLQRFVEDRIDL